MFKVLPYYASSRVYTFKKIFPIFERMLDFFYWVCFSSDFRNESNGIIVLELGSSDKL